MEYSWLWDPVNIKSKLNISNMQYHRINNTILKGRNRAIERGNWTKTRQKLSWVNKSYSSTSRAHGCEMLSWKGLGCYAPTALLIAAHMASLLTRLCSLTAAFLSRHSTFLASLNSWVSIAALTSLLCLHTSSSQGLPGGIMDLAILWLNFLPSLPPKSRWKLPWPPNTGVLHSFRINQHWIDDTKLCCQLSEVARSPWAVAAAAAEYLGS